MRALLASLLLVACAPSSPTPSSAGAPLFFPRHESPYGVGEPMGHEGMLAFRDGCLVIDAANGATYLPIWPADTKPGVINNLPVVLMADERLVIETGHPTTFGGPEIDRERAAPYVVGLPEECNPGGFLLVATVGRE